MIIRILTLLTIALFFSCKNDVKNENANDGLSQESNGVNSETPMGNSNENLSQNDFQGNPERTTVTTTAPDGSVTNTAVDNSNSNSQKTPTTSTLPNASNKADDDVKVKYGKTKQSETTFSIDPNESNTLKVANLTIPDPCGLLGNDFIKGAINLANPPSKRQGSTNKDGYEKSCFWRFEDPKKPNAGIMLQVMINPYSNEIDDFPEMVISSKMRDGEVDPYTNTRTKFKTWNDVTPNGCYSYEAGKYHWRVGKKYVFMLAFNSSHTEAQQREIATKVGKEVLNNYKF